MTEKTIPYTLTGIGEVLWDMLPEGKQLGGAPANFAYHANEQGAKGIIASCIGNDDNGREIIDTVKSFGLTCDYLEKDSEHPTGTVTVELDSEGKPDYTIHENTAWDFIPHTTELIRMASKTDAVCYGSLAQRSEKSRQTISAFLSAACESCIRIFDINLRQHFYNKDIIHNSLSLATVLKINDEELPVVADLYELKGSESDILNALLEKYRLDLIALTRGEKGSTLITPQGSYDHPPITVDVADTVGAGDSFTATMAIGLLKGHGIDRISKNASKVAAYVCSQKGATPKLPEDLLEEIQ
ncbi:MAG: carbohydrate kinase family protein [Planctomycetota bacterium]|jgi:fructokinase